MKLIKLYSTSIIFIAFIIFSIFGAIAIDQIRPAPQTESRGIGEQIRPANQQSLPTEGNGDYHPTEGSSYSSSVYVAPPVSDTVKLKANLNGTNTNATGNVTFSMNKTSNTLNYNLSYSGLSSNASGAEIVIPDLLINDSNNNTVAYSIQLGNLKSGIITFLQNIENYILEGKALVKIRSLLFPNGEISGQIRII